MNPEVRFEIGNKSQIKKLGPELGSNGPTLTESKVSDAIDHCCVSKIRPSEANGLFVYTRRNRNRKRGSIGVLDSEVAVSNDEMDHSCVSKIRPSEVNGWVVYTRNKNRKWRNQSSIGVLDSEVAVNAREADGYAGDIEGEDNLYDVEVKEDPMLVRAAAAAARRFKESVNGLDDSDDVEGNDENENVKVLATPESRKKEMKMSKEICIKEPPATVRELIETGLLEGYPVFYNGGKKGLPLRGTIKHTGIQCFCSFCMGAQVVPPCKFEIHACKSYRRASQYICFENGKSLLDVVKKCQKSSVKKLEKTIQDFIGPLPVKESAICQICNGSFLAISAAKVELLCDSCMIAERVKSRPLEPLLGSTISENGEVRNTLQKEGCSGRKKRKHSELTSGTKSLGRYSLRLSTRKEGQRKTTNILSPPTSGTKSPRSLMKYTDSSSDPTSNHSASLCGSLKSETRETLKRLSNTTSLPNALKSGSPSVSVQSKSSSKITQKDQRMHKLVFSFGGLLDGAEVCYYSHGKKVRGAYKSGSGLICSCCNTLVSPSQFEAHCGWASRRKPYMYIYTSDGISLHEFAVSLLKGTRKNDFCTICADGGKLVLCNGCSKAFHTECASVSSFPSGKWLCTYCQNVPEEETLVQRNANAVANERVWGIDPPAHTTNRCMHVVKDPEETEIIACIICREYDYSKTGFGPRTVILCDQCEKEYHVGCLKRSNMADLKELPQGKWFCSISCKQIYSALENVLDAGEEKIPDFSLDVMRKKRMEKSLVADTDFDVKWRLLNGKIETRETKVLLSQAVAIFHGSFDSIVDLETGRDFIPSLVHGRNIRGQDISGLYCAILTINSKVVSAGILRIFGQDLAELPLAATRTGDQGKGYFQILYSCIEKLLAFLNVKDIVLPSTREAMSLWTKKFGFSKLPEEQVLYYRKVCWQMISFKGTFILGKAVPKCRIINQDEEDSDVPLQ